MKNIGKIILLIIASIFVILPFTNGRSELLIKSSFISNKSFNIILVNIINIVIIIEILKLVDSNKLLKDGFIISPPVKLNNKTGSVFLYLINNKKFNSLYLISKNKFNNLYFIFTKFILSKLKVL
jgi:hypothetical protein